MNVTAADQQGVTAAATKTITTEQALTVLRPKVLALLAEALNGFEVPADDLKSRKYIFRALVRAAAICAVEQGLSPHKVLRNAGKAVLPLLPPPPPMTDLPDCVDESESDESEDSYEN